jgi:hypothetical protein
VLSRNRASSSSSSGNAARAPSAHTNTTPRRSAPSLTMYPYRHECIYPDARFQPLPIFQASPLSFITTIIITRMRVRWRCAASSCAASATGCGACCRTRRTRRRCPSATSSSRASAPTTTACTGKRAYPNRCRLLKQYPGSVMCFLSIVVLWPQGLRSYGRSRRVHGPCMPHESLSNIVLSRAGT